MGNEIYSQVITAFRGRTAPEKGIVAGYAALIDALRLPVPIPIKLTLISLKRRKYALENWRVLPISYLPQENIFAQIEFALKYEGINLLFFKKLFEQLDIEALETWIQAAPLSQYTRKVWFLYEWLMQKQLAISSLTTGNYVLMIDEKLQYAAEISINAHRQRIKNNLPGIVGFCPLIHKTDKLQSYILKNIHKSTNIFVESINKTLLLRAAAFLLLKDSKASFSIEGETPSQNRAMLWGQAIAEAGDKELSMSELLRLQYVIIEDTRFLKMGFRKEGGFVGEHDRMTQEPIPEHISADWQDVEVLIEDLLETAKLLAEKKFPPVLAAAAIAFGFVFIHPFVDGNGRLHRYLIHHILAKMQFSPQGIIFPVSAAILERMVDYQKVLQSYSQPLLNFIKWQKTPYGNVEVLNDTADYYRYFDATPQATFLYECVAETIDRIIPEEITYLQHYDEMKSWLDSRFNMPEKMLSLLLHFLRQNEGLLSKRARKKEFMALTEAEIVEIEENYRLVFLL